ncbi:MAG: hypothetical protein KIT36_21175, partial [Alphaproteobacteria bacterium]|nr:hypothetical protein [Alphaproteobacteria bacterium]
MLGASGKFSGDTYDFAGVMDGSASAGVSHADILLPFADATIGGSADGLARARQAVASQLGPAALIDAAAVIGGFDGITRVADATGIPLDARVAG